MTSQKHPASTIQRQFWVAAGREPKSTAFNVPSVFRIRGPLDVEALRDSLNRIVNRHDVFRTTFVAERDVLFQVVAPPQPIDLPAEAVPGGGDQRGVDAAVRDEISRPFDLKTGPLIRCRLWNLSSNEWVLTVVLHHIISDLRTKDLFGAELSDHYRDTTLGRSPEVAEPVGQYAEYARWHDEFLESDAGRKMCSFWQELLEDRPGLVTLPGELPRPAAQSLRGAAAPFLLPDAFTREVKDFSRQHGANLFLTLLTTFFVLAHRYSGKSAVTIGVPFTNRRQAAHKDLMGCFMNILPIPVDIGQETTFVELLRQVRSRMLEGHRHQEIPLKAIVKHVRPERDARYNPIFQLGFTFEHPMRVDLAGLDVESVKYHPGGAQLDLFPVLWEANGEVRGHVEYCSDLYSPQDASMFVANFEATLRSVLADPECPVSTLPILDPQVKHRIETEWNETKRDYPSDATLKKLFEAQVAQTPSAVAAVFGDERLSYSDFNSRCNRLAHHLIAIGVGPDVPVGIFLDRSMEMLEAVYAVVKAGGAYVPLDPGYPSARISGMLEDAQVPVILTTASLLGELPAVEALTVCVEAERTALEGYPDSNPDVELGPDNIAYIIFTSGSTGRPKGVVNSHGAICNRVHWMQDELGLVTSDSVLQKTPISFDVSVWELFWPLAFGAKLVVAAPGSHRDPSALSRQIAECGITTVHFVPSMLQAFLANADTKKCASLRRVICSGEALPPALVGTFFASMSADLYNLYGPTEAAVDVTCWRCTPSDAENGVPIGKPIANTQIYILDDHMQSVPVGVSGELHIGGVQVAKEYINNPELTSRSFVPDPFSQSSAARLYKTGDVARYLADGNIAFLGRRDSQVQIRGFRVELGGIETLLCEHPGLAQAVVVLEDFGQGDSRLIAYAVPDKRRAFTVLKLIEADWAAPSRGGSSQLSSGMAAVPLPNGLMTCHLNPTETEFLYEEIFLNQSYIRHGMALPENACVFDVGANIGMFSLFVGSMARDATIYAFEPIPPVFAALEQNALIHDLKIVPINLGLSDHVGVEEFTFYPHISILSGTHADADEDRHAVHDFLMRQIAAEGHVEKTTVDVIDELLAKKLKSERMHCRVTTISEVMREYHIENIDLLKIDVERSEQQVLAGIKEDDWRKIRQVCIEVHDRGGRVAEVEALLRHNGFEVVVETGPGVALTMVYGRRGSMPSAPLAARDHAITPEMWEDPTRLTEDVKRSIAAQLPEHMVPSDVVLLAELPLTQSGKINRKALPAYDPRRCAGNLEYALPRPGTETELAQLWAELLKIDRVGADDNFFDIGGNSLLGVYLVGRMESKFAREVSIVKLFEHPTVRSMATYLDQGESGRAFLDEANRRAELRRQRRGRRQPE